MYIRRVEFKNIDSLNPMFCINGQLSRMYRTSNNIFRKYISPFGITNSQLTLLFICAKMDQLNQKQLATIAQLEKSSLNRNLNRLMTKELLTKVDFPLIRITRKGRLLLEHIIPEWEKAMHEIKTRLGDEGVAHIQTVHQLLIINQKR